MLYDFRKKPDSQWTFFVVDNAPKMTNLYRYDTVEEAIARFKTLPSANINAIGSSINGVHEIDHIHSRDGKNVLVMDCAHISLWKDSPEIQSAIDLMIAELQVEYQLSSLFGHRYPSIGIELERYQDRELENYFHNKLLYPKDPKSLISSISEVFVEGKGWLGLEAFLKLLDDSAPKRMGEGARTNFVTRLNISYIDESGHTGQADLSVRNFVLLKEKTERETHPEKLSADLYAFAESLDFYEAKDQEDSKLSQLLQIRSDIATRSLSTYLQFLTESLEEGIPTPEDHKNALSLLSRLTVLCPEEFRKKPLMQMIRNAELKQQSQHPQKRSADKTR